MTITENETINSRGLIMWCNDPKCWMPVKRRAFTLVELLVVVTIISMLIGLLLPAVLASRGRARLAQCMNNQHELSLAITQYDMAKQHLPGFANTVNATTVGWLPVLLPFLGRNDLWADTNGWRSGFVAGTTPTPKIPTVICPDDGESSLVDCPLSYVANVGLYNVSPASTFSKEGVTAAVVIPGLFRDYTAAATTKVSLADVKSASRTILLSEKHDPNLSPLRQWTDHTDLRTGFSWPNYPPQPAPAPQPSLPMDILKATTIGNSYHGTGVIYWGPLPPVHSGIVILTFCDGHAESVIPDMPATTYGAMP